MEYNDEKVSELRKEAEDINSAFYKLRERTHKLIDENDYDGLPNEITEGLKELKYVELINLVVSLNFSPDDIFVQLMKIVDLEQQKNMKREFS
jgi:uncharacterized coiled-coil DUF342 family protein